MFFFHDSHLASGQSSPIFIKPIIPFLCESVVPSYPSYYWKGNKTKACSENTYETSKGAYRLIPFSFLVSIQAA